MYWPRSFGIRQGLMGLIKYEEGCMVYIRGFSHLTRTGAQNDGSGGISYISTYPLMPEPQNPKALRDVLIHRPQKDHIRPGICDTSTPISAESCPSGIKTGIPAG